MKFHFKLRLRYLYKELEDKRNKRTMTALRALIFTRVVIHNYIKIRDILLHKKDGENKLICLAASKSLAIVCKVAIS